MSTFVTSLSLILIGLAMSYPVFFTTIDKNVREGNSSKRFLRLNYILHILTGSIAVFLLWIYGVNYPLQLSGIVYLVVIIVIVLFYWNAPLPKWNLFSASVIFGFIVFYRSFNEMVEITPLWPGIFTGLISVGVVNIVLFLIVSSLKPFQEDRLRTFTNSLLKYFILLIVIRIAWDLVVLFNVSVETRNGELMSALRFFWQVDSIKLILLLLFGLIVPVILNFILSTQLNELESKYRLLAVVMLFLSILLGEFLYKYFLLQYGIVL